MKLTKKEIRSIIIEELDLATSSRVVDYASEDIVKKLAARMSLEEISSLPIFTTEHILDKLITPDLLLGYGLEESHRYDILDKAIEKVKSNPLFSQDSA
jgi:predicted transcriptional regulator